MHLDFGWLGSLYLLSVSWPLAVIDLRERRLPNKLTLPAFPIALVGQLVAVALGAPADRCLAAVLSAVIAFALCLVLNRRAGLGMGDVKLIAAIALCLAWFSPLLPAIAILIGLVIAGLVAIAMVVLRKASMGSSIALGPYLLIGFAFGFIAQGWS
jgi:leader peptidase (prepilin peptidase) / N-methyltransferase